MKKMIKALAIAFIFLMSCTGIKTSSSGLENESFLEIIGTPDSYSGGVDVNIDDKTNFKADVNKDHADRPKGKVYAISTGTHVVTVTHNGQVIYKKQIFISAQETKKIVLQ
jgi:hypothetical protein